MKRVGVIGHFGIGFDLANGQTIKTKIVTEAIEKEINESVYIVDAHGGIKAVVPVIIGCLNALRKCNSVIIMLTENGLKISVPVLSFFNKFFRKKLHYIVIGGWLSKFLSNHLTLRKQLQKFDYIYVETNTMRIALEEKGFTNVLVMLNCKELKPLQVNELEYSSTYPLKLCTFSRVMKEKGIEDAIEVVKYINKKNGKNICNLDIYGQIDAQQIEWFENVKNHFPDYVNYGGVVPFDKSVEKLKSYFVLLFPTKFYTEGIPGTIIDAYAAGVPVISSKWESFSDVVEDGKTGLGYSFGNNEAFAQMLIQAMDQPDIINSYKINCLNKSKDFTLQNAMKVLFDKL